MARYFFHLVAEGRVLRDETGEEFALVEEARGYGLQVARELARNHRELDIAHQQVVLLDSGGVVVFRIPLAFDEYSHHGVSGTGFHPVRGS